MKLKSLWMRAIGLFIAILLALPLQVMAQNEGDASRKMLQKEELVQMLAPIALYPDELVAQILMASTYPIEIVEADRWVQQNKNLTGDAVTRALEKQNWDPSVKSLVNFPSVLSAMSQKLDMTAKIGDAFLAQQKDVMDAIQELRRRAQDAGNLKTTKEQEVVVEKETIVIQPSDPQVVYVPTYDPAVVYGAWAYPAYPPYYYYPPPPAYYPVFGFAAGVAIGAAWGYAWGSCNWHGGRVNYNVNQNININNRIDRNRYAKQGGEGTWRHDSSHRKGVAYKDGATARKYGQSPERSMSGRRDARGYGDGRGGGMGTRPSAGSVDRGGRGGANNAFSGGFGNGNAERQASGRGQASRQSTGSGRSYGGGGSSGVSRGGGGYSGGSRGGGSGGGGRGGGRR
jgi:hypothetical protein